jgi:hypothetical protein
MWCSQYSRCYRCCCHHYITVSILLVVDDDDDVLSKYLSTNIQVHSTHIQQNWLEVFLKGYDVGEWISGRVINLNHSQRQKLSSYPVKFLAPTPTSL